MKQKATTNRPLRKSLYLTPASAALFVMLFAAGGMNNTDCDNAVPGPGGPPGPGTGPQILPSDHVLGSDDAAVTVVEYFDFQCPFCGRFARQEFATIKAQYIDTGLIRWVFRHFPLEQECNPPANLHPRACESARASECADDQGMFVEFHDLLYEDQDDLSDNRFGEIANTLGLDATQFDACIAGNSKAARVLQDVNSGNALAVSATPTFFVNDEVVSGFQTAAQLSEVIDRKLAE